MRAGVIVTGVLGAGTVLVFAAAALVSTLFPNGTTVATGWNGGMVWGKDVMVAPGIPVPAPIDNTGGFGVGPVVVPAEK